VPGALPTAAKDRRHAHRAHGEPAQLQPAADPARAVGQIVLRDRGRSASRHELWCSPAYRRAARSCSPGCASPAAPCTAADAGGVPGGHRAVEQCSAARSAGAGSTSPAGSPPPSAPSPGRVRAGRAPVRRWRAGEAGKLAGAVLAQAATLLETFCRAVRAPQLAHEGSTRSALPGGL